MRTFFLALSAVCWVSGCSRKPADAPPKSADARPKKTPAAVQPPVQQPIKDLPSIQLSDPVVELTPMNIVQCTVKYRFVKGQPDAELWYTFAVSMRDTDNKAPQSATHQIMGKDLKPEGTISFAALVMKPDAATSYSLKATVGKEQKVYVATISEKTLEGSITRVSK